MSSWILPYNPTRIFLSQNDSTIAYILTTSNATLSQGQLLALNISSSVQASALSLQTITPILPFLNRSNTAVGHNAYVPAISKSGTIGVYAGSCSSPSSMWTFQPQNTNPASSIPSSPNGTWTQVSTTNSSSITSSSVVGTHFLASSFYFSPLVNTDDTQRTIYTFGGMCPTGTSSNASTWQNVAMYSNSMLKLTPSSSASSYQVSLSAATGNGPIPEAGFTITGVIPAISNSSSGIVTQAQNFVLIGGHTQTAFINMSQVAIFSLPQESWSFQTIDPASTGNTELAIKSTSSSSSPTVQTPDSRSGHSATLSADGSSIIIFGGWVGDINTPADPQLAILQLGSGFGGSGDWAWNIPSTTGTGLQKGEGIYGHDAVLLPGNVMMVIGGHTITTSSTKSKRDATSQQAYFLNTTSMNWQETYTNPSYIAASGSPSSSSSPTSAFNKSKQVGLGAGLGLGFAAIIGAIAFYFWYTRKVKRRREEAREKDLQRLSRTASNGIEPWWNPSRNSEMVQREGLITSPYVNSPYGGYLDHDDSNSNSPGSGINNYSTIPRKPINPRNARNYYQSPVPGSSQAYPNYNYEGSITRANSLGTAGIIHPIYEADEDNDNADSGLRQAKSQNHDPNDPFRDPSPNEKLNPLRSHPLSRPPTSDRNTPSPESPYQERDHSIKEWASDWAAADALMNSNSASHSRNQSWTGRTSPSKESVSGRTASNLSERSAASASALQLSRNSSTNTRANSLKAFLAAGGAAAWNPFTINNNLGAIDERYNTGGNISPESDRTQRPPNSSGSGSGTSGSYTTAQTSSSTHSYHQTTHGGGFRILRSEGESLLAGRNHHYMEGSPSKHKPRRGWLGSLKRVFVGEEWVSSDGSGSPSPTKAQHAEYYNQNHNSPMTISANGSPTRPSYEQYNIGSSTPEQPRRTVSASATLWRRKQGRGDWEDSADPSERKRSSTMTLDAERMRDGLVNQNDGSVGTETGNVGGEGDDDEWDIERAIERRMVQVMFTVPRGNLRVVNQDIEAEDDDKEVDVTGHSALEEKSAAATTTKSNPNQKHSDEPSTSGSASSHEPLAERRPSSSSNRTVGGSISTRSSTGDEPGVTESVAVLEGKYKSPASSSLSNGEPRRLGQSTTSGRSFSAISHPEVVPLPSSLPGEAVVGGSTAAMMEPALPLEKFKSSTSSPDSGFSRRLRQHPASGFNKVAFSASLAPKGDGDDTGVRTSSVDGGDNTQHYYWHDQPTTSGSALSSHSRPPHNYHNTNNQYYDDHHDYHTNNTNNNNSYRGYINDYYTQQQVEEQYQREVGRARTPTTPQHRENGKKGKGKVQDMVEKIESPQF